MSKLHFAAALFAAAWLLSTPARADPCEGAETLASATRAYQRQGALFATAHYDVRVPGAPPHLETTEFGFDGRRSAYLRMPGLYVMDITDGRLLLASDSDSPARVLQRSALADLQATIDDAFEGHGSPLVPVPLLLRAAHSTDDEVQAFRSRLLEPLRLRTCRSLAGPHGSRILELTLQADNGLVRARFDADSFLIGYQVRIATGGGGAPITAEVTFEPRKSALPADRIAGLARPVERVAHFADLSGGEPGAPIDPLQTGGLRTLDGRAFALDRLVGEPVILEFWARWCPPCRVTLPIMERLAAWARTQRLAVHIVLIDTEEDFASQAAARPEVEAFLRRERLSLPTTLDLDSSFHRRFGGGLPLTVVISPQGQIAARHGGFDPRLEESLRHELRQLAR